MPTRRSRRANINRSASLKRAKARRRSRRIAVLGASIALFVATLAIGLAGPRLGGSMKIGPTIEPSDARDNDGCTAPLPAPGERFNGIVRRIIDGDGLCVDAGAGLIEVRLADFYAPELREAEGEVARAALRRIAQQRPISCIAEDHSYDRVVATCSIDGVSVGEQMQRAGIAQGGRGWR